VNGVDSVCGGVSSIGGESRARGAVNVAVTKTCYYPTNMGSLRDTSILDTQMLHSTGVPRSSSVPLAMFRGRRQTRSSVDLNLRSVAMQTPIPHTIHRWRAPSLLRPPTRGISSNRRQKGAPPIPNWSTGLRYCPTSMGHPRDGPKGEGADRLLLVRDFTPAWGALKLCINFHSDLATFSRVQAYDHPLEI